MEIVNYTHSHQRSVKRNLASNIFSSKAEGSRMQKIIVGCIIRVHDCVTDRDGTVFMTEMLISAQRRKTDTVDAQQRKTYAK
jgi:hypothetical protein